MTALEADLAAPPTAPASRGRSRARKPSAAGRVVAVALGGASAAAGLALAAAYPLHHVAGVPGPTVAIALFVAWALFAALRFSVAFPAVLALLPVVGFAPWTGWLTFEELDLLILATAAGAYATRAILPPAPPGRDAGARLSVVALAGIGLFAASLAIALVRGIDDAGGMRFDWFQGYDDPLNSVRIAKSFVFALLVAPLVATELRRPGGFDRFALGMTAGLAVCALAVVDERLAFTGLLDFSDDYRVTAPFWEMHTGGAALDGFLALTIPFAVRAAIRATTPARLIAGWAVLALAAYASLVTFSRGVYAAVPLSLVVAAVLVFRQRVRIERRAGWAALVRGAVFAAVVAGCGVVAFRHGGYRAVIATFAVLAVAIPAESALRRTGPAAWVGAALAAAVLGAVGTLVGTAVPKGPYVVAAVAILAAAIAVAIDARRPTRAGATAVVATWLWLAIAACGVAARWGAGPALRDAALVATVLVVATFVASRAARSPWPAAHHHRVATVGFAAAVMASVAVFSAGAYMGGRFAQSSGDLALRLSHWTEGIGRLRGADWWLGKGLGRFPSTSLYSTDERTARGSYRLVRRDGETFVALASPKIRYLGFFQWMRLSQRVTVTPHTTYTAFLRVRAPTASAVHVEICEKQLLYPGPCATGYAQYAASDGAWREGGYRLETGTIGTSPWYARRPVFLAIAVDGPPVEIASIRVVGPDGVDIVENGDFADRTARWFSSSDRYHLPWHIKNIALDVLFDQGIVGLVAFALLVGGAWLRTAVGRGFRHPDAPYVAAAIAGYLVVGAFDSLLDVPRVAFAFFVVVIVGLMLRAPRLATAAAPSAAAALSPIGADVPVPAPAVDEAAERARRRQRAFGERRGPRDRRPSDTP